MEITQWAVEELEVRLAGTGHVTVEDGQVVAHWVDGPDADALASALQVRVGPYTGSSLVGARRSYSNDQLRLVLHRDHSDAAIGTTALMSYLLWGCEECDEVGIQTLLKTSLRVDRPELPSSHPGSERVLLVGGARVEERYRRLGELLGSITPGDAAREPRVREAGRHLCSLGHLEGLVALDEALHAHGE